MHLFILALSAEANNEFAFKLFLEQDFDPNEQGAIFDKVCLPLLYTLCMPGFNPVFFRLAMEAGANVDANITELETSGPQITKAVIRYFIPKLSMSQSLSILANFAIGSEMVTRHLIVPNGGGCQVANSRDELNSLTGEALTEGGQHYKILIYSESLWGNELPEGQLMLWIIESLILQLKRQLNELKPSDRNNLYDEFSKKGMPNPDESVINIANNLTCCLLLLAFDPEVSAMNHQKIMSIQYRLAQLSVHRLNDLNRAASDYGKVIALATLSQFNQVLVQTPTYIRTIENLRSLGIGIFEAEDADNDQITPGYSNR